MQASTSRHQRMRRIIWIAGLIAWGLSSGASHGAIFRRENKVARQTVNVSKEELRTELNDFTDYFITQTKQASAELDGQLPTAKTRKMTLMWRLRASQALFTALAQDDPVAAFVDAWALCVRLSDFFEHGNGSEVFEARQKIATEATLTIEREAERIGRSFMDEKAFSELKTYIDNLSAKNPIRSVHSFALYASRSIAEEAGPLREVLSLPMAPFRALEGVDRGAVAMHRFTDTAERITDIVELLPESMRWQLLLLLFEMEETELVQSVLKNMDDFSDSSSRLAESAEKLPERLRVQAALLVDEIDQKQANLQETLNRAEKTAATVERTVVQVDEAAKTIDQSAQTLTQTAQAWQATIEATTQMAQAFSKDGPPPETPPKPFDIQEYQAAMEAATDTAQQLHALATEIHAIVESQQLSGRIADVNDKAIAVVGRTAAEAQRLADVLTWRVGGLILFFFALALAYRFIVVRVLGKDTIASA
jgi:hypothetical protein